MQSCSFSNPKGDVCECSGNNVKLSECKRDIIIIIIIIIIYYLFGANIYMNIFRCALQVTLK